MYSKYPKYPKPITPKAILPKIPKCKTCKREMPSLSNVRAHFPQCIKNTVMFDCEGNYTEITKVVIDTIYEYYGYKGVILFLNYPIGNRRNHWGEGFYARLLFSAYKTILSSYIEALTSGDNETHKTVCNDTDRSNFNISRGTRVSQRLFFGMNSSQVRQFFDDHFEIETYDDFKKQYLAEKG